MAEQPDVYRVPAIWLEKAQKIAKDIGRETWQQLDDRHYVYFASNTDAEQFFQRSTTAGFTPSRMTWQKFHDIQWAAGNQYL